MKKKRRQQKKDPFDKALQEVSNRSMSGTSLHQFDPVVGLTDSLCQIPSFLYHSKNGLTVHAEEEIGEFVESYLQNLSWLSIQKEPVSFKRTNLFVSDGPEEDIELLIVAHLDTTSPSSDWHIPEFSVQDDCYYALGAADVKAAMAAVLDAAKQIGPTKGVGYLFYVDAMGQTSGMKSFIEAHPNIKPKTILSVCGAGAEPLFACRGCIEIEFTLKGHGAHSSKRHLGSSAFEAMCHVTQSLDQWCKEQNEPVQTTCNVSCIKAGSLRPGVVTPQQGLPPMYLNAGRVPDVAWVLIDIRPGDSSINANRIKTVIESSLVEWNTRLTHPVTLTKWHVQFEGPGFHSTASKDHKDVSCFAPVHNNHFADPSCHGYYDVALLASRLPETTTICLSPKSGNKQGPDEWVDIQGLLTYRDSIKELLTQRKI